MNRSNEQSEWMNENNRAWRMRATEPTRRVAVSRKLLVSLLVLPVSATGFSPVGSSDHLSNLGRLGVRVRNFRRWCDNETGRRPKVLSPHEDNDSTKTAHHGHRCNLNSNMHSASDWLHNIRMLPESTVMREIRNPVLSTAAWATIVSVLHRLLLVFGRHGFAKKLCISSSPHSFSVSALGLLLVFRTNSAYQRFSEGRKIWEQVLSTSRNLSRFITLYEDEIGSNRKLRLQKLLVAFPYLLRHHIRPKCLNYSRELAEHGLLLKVPPQPKTQTRYEGDELDTVKYQSNSPRQCWVDRREHPWKFFNAQCLDRLSHTKNRPLWVLDRMAKEIADVKYRDNYTSRERLSLLGHVEKLTNAIGECERIHQTAVPLNYARHSLRGLTLWLFTLPFALIKDLGLLTGPAMGAVAWLLFGIYQIGHSIEDPFQGSIRLSILCDGIREDVLGAEDRDTAFSLHANHMDDSAFPASPNISLLTKNDDFFSVVKRTKLGSHPVEMHAEVVVKEDSRKMAKKKRTWM